VNSFIRSSFSREAFRTGVGQGRFPGFRVIASPPTFPGDVPSGACASSCARDGGGLAGYSGGTAQALDLLPS